MSSRETIEQRKAQILMKLRGYRRLRRKKSKEDNNFLVKTSEGEKTLIFCWPTQGTVGVQVINQVKKAMKEEEVEKAIVVTSGRYTQAAKVHAKKRGIELIPRLFPAFNIFEHVLVPKHEIVDAKEREKLLAQYRVQPYQLPKIKASDPAAKVIDAQPGDIVRITRDSPTAGRYTSYRYVIEG